MKILILSPLYPPDIAIPAPYVKELAKRLKDTHEVTILTYGRIPETIDGVKIHAVDKRLPLLSRLKAYKEKLETLEKNVDVLYLENGASVELPALSAKKPIVFHIGDPKAYEQAQKNTPHKILHDLVRNRARTVFATSPLPKPEILPFQNIGEAEKAQYEESWKEHLEEIESHINHE